MSHACVLVLIDTYEGIGGRIGTDDSQSVEDQVAALMEPHKEGDNPEGWWDWWQIGGRWTGMFSGYDPGADPSNQETCDLCKGTGTRPDGIEKFGQEWAKWCGGCNGCQGTGISKKWPTHYAKHDGDIQPVEAVLEWLKNNPAEGIPCYTILSQHECYHRKTWEGGPGLVEHPDFEENALRMLQNHPGRVVVVDYHS